MTVFRYMSFEEFNDFKIGKTLVNHTDHSKEHCTNSKGFCFLDECDHSPESAYEFLSGIVSDDVCVRFEVDDELLTMAYGTYADPFGNNWNDNMTIDEYCCESYNNKDFKMLDYRCVNAFEPC